MNAIDFIHRYNVSRLAFLHALGTWSVFGVGWSARVNDLTAYALALAKADKDPHVLGASAKSYSQPVTMTTQEKTTPPVVAVAAKPSISAEVLDYLKKMWSEV
jgi:lysozyme family protein